ncbi:MAG: hypothetical protein JO025_21995 [Verrucomicrobia bacterium]|nr:hypothetical protein [Verrucomicrobiota bacterium]
MEPKTKHTEYEENGTRIERTTVDDPDTNTHSEEIDIERKGQEKQNQPDEPQK